MNGIEYLFLISFLFPVLYAETHYRFKYFFSWLKKSEPEIIADIPSRIQQGKELPVLIIIKDADRYNTEIISVQIYLDNKIILSKEMNRSIQQAYFDEIIFVDTSNFDRDIQYIDVVINYKIKNKIKCCHNDNHRGTKHQPFPIYISDSPLPKFSNCIYGETHSHTNYTSDQLEFGGSIKSMAALAEAMGLSFFCATDHSYDLDDEEHNYLRNDSNLPKWKKLLKEINHFNQNNNQFKVISGEEASLHNHKNKNIHCLIYNSEKFYPGNGDSGEKWLHPFSELTIEDVLNDVDSNTLVFAAHPVEPVPFLQRILIRRDNWYAADCRNKRLNGLQFANGGPYKYFFEGKKLWIKLLLEGYKLIGIAGNDAHGNFGRYRQVSFPFIKMTENYFHLFGYWRTGLYIDSDKTEKQLILNSLKKGNCFITNGPALQFAAIADNIKYAMGSSVQEIFELEINGKSSVEFGKISKIIVLQGVLGETTEESIFEKKLTTNKFETDLRVKVECKNEKGYFRCELETNSGKIALSNPIWYK